MTIALATRLAEQRQNIWKQAQGILDSAEAESRDLSAEDQASLAKIDSDLDSLRAQIDQIASVEARNRSVDEAFGRIGVDARTSEQDDAGSQFRALARGEIRSFEVSPIQMRDLTKGTDASGGAAVPKTFYAQLWENLIDTAALMQYATVLTTSGGGPIEMPVVTSKSSAALIAENSTITESDPAFVRRSLSSYKYAVAFQVPSELLQDEAVDLEGFLAAQAGEAVGNALGSDLMVGNGSSKPSGLFQTTTLGVTGGTGVTGAFTADNLIDLYYSVGAKYRNSRSAAWVMKDATIATARKFKDTTNQYIWVPGLGAAPDTIMGKPVLTDPYVAAVALNAKSVAFGDLSRYWVRIAGAMRFERSDDFAFSTDQVTYRCVLRGDGILADQAGAVKHFIGAAS